MKRLLFALCTGTISVSTFSQMAVYDGVVHQSVIQLSVTEKQELAVLKTINKQTRENTQNTYKTYEQSKRSANFLDKLYKINEETELVLRGETTFADTIKQNESNFLKQAIIISNQASDLADKMSKNNDFATDESYGSKLCESEVFISEIGFLLNKALECRKLAGIHDDKTPLSPYERMDLKLKADNFLHEAEIKVIECKKNLVALDDIMDQLKSQQKTKSTVKQQNSNYSREYNIKQPLIGQGVKN